MSENAESDVSRSEDITIDTLEKFDFDIIQDMPWAQKLWEEIQDHTKIGFLNWCNIAKKMVGTKAEHVGQWSTQYMKSMDETCCDLVLDLSALQSKTMETIQELLARLQKLCVELHLNMPRKIGERELSLFEEQHRLVAQINEYETIINSKKKDLEKLHENQRRLCKYLGQEPKFTLEYPPLPTPAQIENFQKYIEQLESEKFEREEKYCILKDDITKNVDELKYKPTSDFERKLLSSDNFLVSLDNLKKLELFAINLKEIKKSTKEEISQLRERIEALWKLLDVELMDRDEFRSHYTGNSLDTLEALRTEVKRCEEIRKANMKIFIDKLRVELQNVWKECHCTDSVRRSFKYFNSDCYTEDLLDLHEMELKKWQNYREENAELFGLLEKHLKLWEKIFELEENATGANRYHNRGGRLLKEEKERNKLNKLIPKIEEEIRQLSEDFRIKNNGVSFKTYGKTPEEYIDNLYAERENARKLKHSARKTQRDHTIGHTPAKSAISLFPSTSTAVTPNQISTNKRKILTTPSTENIKRLRVLTPRSVNKPLGTPIIPTIKISHVTMSLPRQKRRSKTSMERRKRLDTIRRRSRKSRSFDRKVAADSDTTRNTTYTDFQTELSSREAGRSTVLPEDLLKTPGVSSPKKKTPNRINALSTPKRTPASVYKTPASRTPNSVSKSSNNLTKLSTCKSNLKLLF